MFTRAYTNANHDATRSATGERAMSPARREAMAISQSLADQARTERSGRTSPAVNRSRPQPADFDSEYARQMLRMGGASHPRALGYRAYPNAPTPPRHSNSPSFSF
jgi:hypothetical protein